MGQRVLAAAWSDDHFEVVAALESAKHPRLGQDAGTLAGLGEIGIPLTSDGLSEADVAIDFSLPEAAVGIADRCREQGVPIVIATTGLDRAQSEHIRGVAADIPVVFAPSMSTAVNVLMKLAETAGKVLKDVPGGLDLEIIERHHRYKEDAPSGTALRFGQILADATGKRDVVHGREGQVGQRRTSEIGYHAVRTGDNPGEHTIVFGMLGETIELRVAASNRDCYAQGALLAARWLVGKPAGLYSMNDVLGL